MALLEAEVVRARAVLAPFASKACGWEQNHPGQRGSDSQQISHRLGDFRTARAFMIWSEGSGVGVPVDQFTVSQWDCAIDDLADAMEVEGVCASDLVRIVVEALGLPPLSPEARLQHMMDARS